MSTGRWADVRETHIGVVFLLGDRAYKLKKPVKTGFLDFSTPQRRLAACRREVELNRRLAPDVYLGISSVSAVVDPRLPGPADPVEHMVVMRRMPDDRRLSALVRAGVPVGGHLRALARSVAAFHSAAARGPEITVEGGRDAVARRWAANVAEVRAQPPVLPVDLVDAVDRLSGRFLAGREPLFTDRGTQSRIIDGHGDLITDDVFCLDDGPRALDCLEFDDRLRYVDGLDDVAFLAMDLERLGRPDLAEAWLDAYVEFSADPAPSALRHHYVAYRAFVRAKVACLRTLQGDTDAAAEAHRYAELARRHLESGAVRLALVGGLPGTGKTTVAGRLADRAGAVLLSSDRPVRRGHLQPGSHRRGVRGVAAPGRCAAGPRGVGGSRRLVDPSAPPSSGRGVGPEHPQRSGPPALHGATGGGAATAGHPAPHGIGCDRRDRHRPGRGRRSVARGASRTDDRLRRSLGGSGDSPLGGVRREGGRPD
jgi:aminoglycoside phosphotransferase family enzyme